MSQYDTSNSHNAWPNHRGPKITAIETFIPRFIHPGLLLMRIHTDEGQIGHGETYYIPQAVAATIHDWMARRLLGTDALAIESHWRYLYERCANFGVRGCELRAISAIDLALWDILGQVTNQPIYQLLGGAVRPHIPIYNTCGGPSYGPNKSGTPGWPGMGGLGKEGPLEDLWASENKPAELAEELLAEGITAMKFWPFDKFGIRDGGHRISWGDIELGMKPLREIRKRVGNKIEIAIEGHAFFHLPAALRIAEACREIQPMWLEDVLRVDNIDTLADFRRQSRMPISASEMLLARPDYAMLLEKRAADFVMIDPTWNGGISETVRVAHMAQAYNIPCTMHDCTGPLTLFSGLHVASALSVVHLQETVRAHIRTMYPRLIDTNVVINKGCAELPTGVGLGTRLLPELFDKNNPDYRLSGKL